MPEGENPILERIRLERAAKQANGNLNELVANQEALRLDRRERVARVSGPQTPDVRPVEESLRK